MKRFVLFLLLQGGLLFTSAAAAGDNEGPTHNLVNLSAEATADVDNDVLVAILGVSAEGSQTPRLSDQVNRTINAAVDQAKAIPGVKVQTHGYHTSPIYRNDSIRAWRVQQSLRLESRDAGTLSDLIARLQESLNLESLGFQVSDEARRAAEAGLITEALARFTDRARLITSQLGRSGFRLVRINVNTSGGASPRPMARGMAMAAEAVTAPNIEAGTQKLRVTVNGTVEVTED